MADTKRYRVSPVAKGAGELDFVGIQIMTQICERENYVKCVMMSRKEHSEAS
jgi:hypothetical protein